jgi:hypothetical protein
MQVLVKTTPRIEHDGRRPAMPPLERLIEEVERAELADRAATATLPRAAPAAAPRPYAFD